MTQTPVIDPSEIAGDWLTTAAAAELLSITPKALLKVRGQTVRHVRGRIGGSLYGSDGYLWWARDVKQLANIRKGLGVSLNVALRIMAAERPRNADFAKLANTPHA